MKLIFFIPLAIAIALLVVWLTQTVWNAVVPEVFTGMHTISFFQTFLLLLLSNLLIRSSSYSGKLVSRKAT